MKKIVLIALACLPAQVFAQGGKYIVEGVLGTYGSPAKVYLRYAQYDRSKNKVITITDSATLNNGKFKFKGSLTDDPIMAELMFNAKGTGPSYDDAKQVYLENGTITINGTGNLAKATVTGTPSNIDNEKLDAALTPINSAYDSITAKQNAATPEQKQSEAFIKEIDKDEKAIRAQEIAIEKKFVQENPDSYISLVTLESLAYWADYRDIAPLFNGMSGRMKQTVGGKHFAERLPDIKAVALGVIAPEFAEADTSGKMISLSSFRGKYVLIDFWASWCGPCRGESPNLVKAYNRYKGQNFTIIGVSLDAPKGKKAWLDAVHKDGLNWTQVSDLKAWNSKVAKQYAVRGIPQNFLLDPDGKIIAKNLRGDDLEDKLEELFGKI